jgi:integrase
LIRTAPYPAGGAKPSHFRAFARFRGFDGRTRQVEAWGRSKTAAEQALRRKLQDFAAAGRHGELTASTRFSDAVDVWLEGLDSLVEQGRRSPGTVETYRRQLRNHVLPTMGQLRLGEITTPLVDRVLLSIRREVSGATAKTSRTVISGVMGTAVRQGAISVNPAREVQTIDARPARPPRALTPAERIELVTHLNQDESARRRDLPDLVFFMLSTGARIGEALATLWSDVDLEAGTVAITSTLIRVRGEGLYRKATKTRTGERTLPLPDSAVEVLRRRFMSGARLDQPVFPDLKGGFRDPNNVRRDLRRARGDGDLAWITSHTFRKTAATILDEAALSARLIADQLGHARPSMTQDVYLTRRAVDDRAAQALDEALRGALRPERADGKEGEKDG